MTQVRNGVTAASLMLLAVLVAACPSRKNGGGDDDDDAQCIAETDATFCTRLGKTCEQVTGTDNCGAVRSAACGTCSGADACVVNVCQAPVCANLTFGTVALLGELNTANQDALQSITPSGDTVLELRSTVGCGTFGLWIADRAAGTYTPVEITGAGAMTAFDALTENSLTLTPDGLSIVGLNPGRTAFLQSTRSALGAIDFTAAVPGPFANIVPAGAQTFSAPVLSADGLAFYYVVGNDLTAINGIYESVRASTDDPFPQGSRMPAAVQDYSYVRGTSSDRMSLFVETNFVMSVLTRKSVTQPFVNPNDPAAAPTVPGFRSRPLADCSALLGNSTLAGCPGEDIGTFPH